MFVGCSLAQRLNSLRSSGDSQTANSQRTAIAAAPAPQTHTPYHIGNQCRAEVAPFSKRAAATEPQVRSVHAKRLDTEALLAALLFAAHPVHTEAVAGIVGHAELLCAALFIAALLAYMCAVDGTSAEGSAAQWQPIAASLALVALAAFAKEIGITAVSFTLACKCSNVTRVCTRRVATQAELANYNRPQLNSAGCANGAVRPNVVPCWDGIYRRASEGDTSPPGHAAGGSGCCGCGLCWHPPNSHWR